MMGVIFLAQHWWVQEKANPPDSSRPHWTWALGLGLLEMSSRHASPCVGSCLSELIFPSGLAWASPRILSLSFSDNISFLYLVSPTFSFSLPLPLRSDEIFGWAKNITTGRLNLVKIMLSPRVSFCRGFASGDLTGMPTGVGRHHLFYRIHECEVH